jgi:X-X-X-Leu-X-X-Gly heptad repeat protein
MNDDKREPEPAARVGTETTEKRSLDAVYQGAQALGELTGGVGALAIGVSKLKEAFGGGDQTAEPPPQPSTPPASPDESK